MAERWERKRERNTTESSACTNSGSPPPRGDPQPAHSGRQATRPPPPVRPSEERLHLLALAALLVCLFSLALLLVPIAWQVGSCAWRTYAEPAEQSTVRLLGGLPGLAAVNWLLLADGSPDQFSLHAPFGSDVGALLRVVDEAVGSLLPPLPSPIAASPSDSHRHSRPQAASTATAQPTPPAWRLAVRVGARAARSCAYMVDAPLPPPPLTRLAGLTLVAHDTSLAVAHYFHVMEHLLAHWALRETFFPNQQPQRLVFAGGRTHDSDIATTSPKGAFARALITAVFPNVSILPPSQWARLTRTGALLLDAAAVSSRATSHRNAPVAALNKMLAVHATAIRPHANAFRSALLHGLGVRLPPKLRPAQPAALPLLSTSGGGAGHAHAPLEGPTGAAAANASGAHSRRLLRVGVVDRGESSRRLSAEFKSELLRALRADGRFDARPLRFQDLPDVASQARAAAELDIMFGCHGNGLTHALLMRPPAVMVELFPANINHADYQLHAEIAGHRHFGWSDKSGLLTRSPYVVDCAQRYGVYARYRRKSDPSVFTGVGGDATIARLIELAYALATAPDEPADGWRALIAPPDQSCARDGRM